jgi:uncharacterized DUF497 family protein
MKISGLDWDDDNIDYIGKRGISPEEVGDICFGLHLSRKDSASKSHGKERYILAGKTKHGRYLDIVVQRLYATYFRPVTAFEMSENYKRRFDEKVGRRIYDDDKSR